MKFCPKCSQEKPYDDFYVANRGYGDGYQTWCKACGRDYRIQKRAKDEHYNRRFNVRSKYGIEFDEVLKILETQGNACASCRTPLEIGKRTHIDHCHATDVVRGVLCGDCNWALGCLHDDPGRIRGLLAYAEKHHQKRERLTSVKYITPVAGLPNA